MDRGGWWVTVHGLTKSQTQLSNWHSTFTFFIILLLWMHVLCHVWFFVTPWTVTHLASLSWYSPDKNTGVGNQYLLQDWIFPIQQSNPHLLHLLHYRQILYHWATWGRHITSTQFSCSVVSDSLLPHGLQHARPPCPSPTPEFTQTNVHWVCDAIQPSHPLSSPSPPAYSLSQHQGLFKWVSSLHQVVKVLEFELQPQSFQWTLRTDLL